MSCAFLMFTFDTRQERGSGRTCQDWSDGEASSAALPSLRVNRIGLFLVKKSKANDRDM